MTLPIASISMAARVTLDMHSLNNEGSDGNEMRTRMVHIVGADGRLHHVNALSGDTFKHILCQHFFRVARESGLALCAGCAVFDANRINADHTWIEQIPATDREAVSSVLGHCALDDVAGTFITTAGPAGKRAVRRHSVVEFGWGVAIPSLVQTELHFHAKHVGELSRDQLRAHAAARERDGSNLGPAIFYRPVSSGIYALICHIELARIGLNDISLDYAVDEQEQTSRAKALLQSVLYTILELNGAMRNTQLPHVVGTQGVLTFSRRRHIPAPLISPLVGGAQNEHLYIEEAMALAKLLGGEQESLVECVPFRSMSEFAVEMDKLITEVAPSSDPVLTRKRA